MNNAIIEIIVKTLLTFVTETMIDSVKKVLYKYNK